MFGILLIKKTQGQVKLCFVQQEEALAFGSEGPGFTLGSVPRATYYLYVYFLICKGAVSQSALATRTKYHKYHRPGALNNRHLSFISHGSGTGKRSGCQHDRVLVKACRWPCSCCILTWERKGERDRDRERERERERKRQRKKSKTQLFGVFLGGH